MNTRLARPAGIAVGLLLDRAVGDPRRGHPVALFGTAAARVERRLNNGTVRRGALAHAGLVGSCIALGTCTERRRPAPRFVATAVATWAVLGGRTLAAEGSAVADLLAANDLPGARRRVTHLVGRITDDLSASEVARAALESVAENTSDAIVAPLFWGAVCGVPGLLGYRAVNTLDAMWGHRTPRFEAFGRVAARVDDVANLAPARLSAAAVAVLPALVAPQVIWPAATGGQTDPVRLASAAAALGVGLVTRNTLAAIIGGGVVLGLGSWLF